MNEVPFDDLGSADLVVDAIYRGGSYGNVRDDPLARLLPCGNQGGFRFASRPGGGYRMAILYSSGIEADWPDRLDEQTGTYTYFGDNRTAGTSLSATKRGGNRLLEAAFAAAHSASRDPNAVPPFFAFQGARSGRSVRFVGLAAPGAPGLGENDDLVAVWRSSGGKRFQNYRAQFTILDVGVVPRIWIAQLAADNPLGQGCPKVWREWVTGRAYKPLAAPPTINYRTKEQQEPATAEGKQLIRVIHEHYRDRATDFERCADNIWRMIAPRVTESVVTRPTRDGGRDVIGKYTLGPASDPILIDFALEAKCYQPGHSVGVREVSRLISRLRHRQFGVLVTTSHINQQAYQEIRQDGHPIAIVAGGDIVEALRAQSITTVSRLKDWLNAVDVQ